jgi:glycosyltransferase involved in cell wall biosynthesis
VPEKDVEALFEALTRLVDHPETRVKMGLAGRARVEKDFNSAKLNPRLLQLLRGQVPSL